VPVCERLCAYLCYIEIRSSVILRTGCVPELFKRNKNELLNLLPCEAKSEAAWWFCWG